MNEPAACHKCGGPLAERPAHRYPVVSQVAFALSFVAFLLFGDRFAAHPNGRLALGLWCAGQVALGILLIRQRLRTRVRVWRCIRCGAPLPLDRQLTEQSK